MLLIGNMNAQAIAEERLLEGDPSDRVWAALAHPVRREILDLLRARPRKTGELAAEVPLSRFAVMKHLGVLEEASLVIVRREGRERWNHLNAVPLQRVHERWVRRYEAHWASALLRLKAAAEAPEGDRVMPEPAEPIGWTHVEVEVPVARPPEAVWKSLTEEIGAWWLDGFYGGADPKGFRLEAKLGGRMYEDWGDGNGLVWYTVMSLEPPKSLLLAGQITAAFGGPASTTVQITLEPDGDGTKVRLSDDLCGRVTDESAGKIEGGWRMLLTDGLKAHAESAA